MPGSQSNKILFIPSWYPNRTEHSSGNFVKRQIEANAAFDDVAVLFVAPTKDFDKKYELILQKNNGFTEAIVYYRKVNNSLFFGNIRKALRRMKAYNTGYKALLSEWGKPQLINVEIAFPAILYAYGLSKRKGIPYILTEHGIAFYKEAKGSLFSTYKRAIEKAKKIVTVSNYLADAMRKRGIKNNFEVIPNVVPLPSVLPDIKPPTEKKRILHISTLADVKNVNGILRALKELRKIRQDFELVILGEKQRKEVHEYISALQLNDIVTVRNFTSDVNEIASLILSSNFMVMFSNYETFSVVLAESLWAGRPVITTRCGGPEEFITEEFGMFVEPGDEKGLEKAIDKMLDTWQIYDTKRLKEFARNNFAPEIIGRKMHQLHSSFCQA